MPFRRRPVARHGLEFVTATTDLSYGRGQLGQRVGTEPRPHPAICSRIARSAGDGISAKEPALEPISIHVSGFPGSERRLAMPAVAENQHGLTGLEVDAPAQDY
jgi:hypothetical protein